MKLKRIGTCVLVGVLATSILAFSGCSSSQSSNSESSTNSSSVEETTSESEALTEAPTETPTTVPPTTVHTHQWEDITSTVHHDAVKEQTWIVDKPKEIQTCYVRTFSCSFCGDEWKFDSGAEPISRESEMRTLAQDDVTNCQELWLDACRRHNEYVRKGIPEPVLEKPIDYSHSPELLVNDDFYQKEIPEQGHYENKVIKEAYDETIITGQKCKTCGETKQVKNN